MKKLPVLTLFLSAKNSTFNSSNFIMWVFFKNVPMKTLRNQKFTNEQLCWTPFVKAFEFFSVCFRKKIWAKSFDDKKRTILRPSKPQRWLMGARGLTRQIWQKISWNTNSWIFKNANSGKPRIVFLLLELEKITQKPLKLKILHVSRIIESKEQKSFLDNFRKSTKSQKNENNEWYSQCIFQFLDFLEFSKNKFFTVNLHSCQYIFFRTRFFLYWCEQKFFHKVQYFRVIANKNDQTKIYYTKAV